MPSSTRPTGAPTSFTEPNTSSSSESRLTVTRCSPASRRLAALRASRLPLVVSAMSSMPSIAASISTSRSRSRRSSGSPPVRRSLRTPAAAKSRASRAISSNVSSCERRRNSKSRPKTSFGMQYTQRKLQRSVTEMRRSRSGRLRVSVTGSTYAAYPCVGFPTR